MEPRRDCRPMIAKLPAGTSIPIYVYDGTGYPTQRVGRFGWAPTPDGKAPQGCQVRVYELATVMLQWGAYDRVAMGCLSTNKAVRAKSTLPPFYIRNLGVCSPDLLTELKTHEARCSTSKRAQAHLGANRQRLLEEQTRRFGLKLEDESRSMYSVDANLSNTDWDSHDYPIIFCRLKPDDKSFVALIAHPNPPHEPPIVPALYNNKIYPAKLMYEGTPSSLPPEKFILHSRDFASGMSKLCLLDRDVLSRDNLSLEWVNAFHWRMSNAQPETNHTFHAFFPVLFRIDLDQERNFFMQVYHNAGYQLKMLAAPHAKKGMMNVHAGTGLHLVTPSLLKRVNEKMRRREAQLSAKHDDVNANTAPDDVVSIDDHLPLQPVAFSKWLRQCPLAHGRLQEPLVQTLDHDDAMFSTPAKRAKLAAEHHLMEDPAQAIHEYGLSGLALLYHWYNDVFVEVTQT